MFGRCHLPSVSSINLGEDIASLTTKGNNGCCPKKQVTPILECICLDPLTNTSLTPDPGSDKHRADVVGGPWQPCIPYSPTPVSGRLAAQRSSPTLTDHPTHKFSAYQLVSVESRSLPFQGSLMQAKPAISTDNGRLSAGTRKTSLTCTSPQAAKGSIFAGR